MRRSLGERLWERIILLPFLPRPSFLALGSLADAVLEPVPVGGGVSTAELLGVGAPVVGYIEGVTVMQLTRGMYAKMGMSSNNPMLTHTPEDFGAVAASLGTNHTFAAEQRRRVRTNVAHLFDCSESVAEWTRFLLAVSTRPRPS